jgi:shikimate dehydrogenase
MTHIGPIVLRVGLIGAGIQASRTPAMHMREGAEQGLRYDYGLIDLELLGRGIEALPELVAEAERRGFAGLNITHPCKQAVIPLLHALSDDARALGAVNTVVFENGRRTGHNTDWWGFAESFRREMADVNPRRVVLVGAGGAGAAVGYAMLKSGTQELSVHDMDRSRAVALAERMSGLFQDRKISVCDDVAAALASADGLVHATPTGMQKYPGIPVPAECLRPPLWVAEIVYVPLLTELLRTARQHGCRTLDGDGMAVFQGAMAFKLFFDVNPDVARMQRRFHSKLATAAA